MYQQKHINYNSFKSLLNKVLFSKLPRFDTGHRFGLVINYHLMTHILYLRKSMSSCPKLSFDGPYPARNTRYYHNSPDERETFKCTVTVAKFIHLNINQTTSLYLSRSRVMGHLWWDNWFVKLLSLNHRLRMVGTSF